MQIEKLNVKTDHERIVKQFNNYNNNREEIMRE
jgi:hypothetical protein